jgi:tryptophanyl-tRNA synthetase
MENQIIFTTEGNISKDDIYKLEKNNVVVIQVKDLQALKTINDIDNDIILESAMDTLSVGLDQTKGKFFDKFYLRIKENKKIK